MSCVKPAYLNLVGNYWFSTPATLDEALLWIIEGLPAEMTLHPKGECSLGSKARRVSSLAGLPRSDSSSATQNRWDPGRTWTQAVGLGDLHFTLFSSGCLVFAPRLQGSCAPYSSLYLLLLFWTWSTVRNAFYIVTQDTHCIHIMKSIYPDNMRWTPVLVYFTKGKKKSCLAKENVLYKTRQN